jgi:hypothetical protein
MTQDQPLTDAQAALVEAAQMQIARQRLKLQQKQQGRKATKQ